MKKTKRRLLYQFIVLTLIGIVILPFSLYISVVIIPTIFPNFTELKSRYVITFLLFFGICLIYLIISFYFFMRIRRRIVHLQRSMQLENDRTELEPIEISQDDEIGELEESFNEMVQKLNESYQKELDEEKLRRTLIANLSHDLKTPLTAMRAQMSSFDQNEYAKEVRTMNNNIDDISHLIDSLLAFSLLSANKHPYEEENINLSRHLRSYIANWYLVFEEEGFTVDVDIQNEDIKISTDINMINRLLNNIVQNVLRHAHDGKYIKFELNNQAIIISDKGRGLSEDSKGSGAGIGLKIMDLLAEKLGFNLNFKEDSGLVVTINFDE